MGDDPSIFLRASEQRTAAQFMSRTLKQQAEFFRKEECYCIGDWSLTNRSITSAPFRIDSRAQCLAPFSDLDSAGYRFTDAIGIHFHPKSMDPMKLRALLSYAGEGELTQLREVFGFSGGPTIFLDAHGIEMILSMSEFRHDALEICLLMFARLIRMSGLLCTKRALREP